MKSVLSDMSINQNTTTHMALLEMVPTRILRSAIMEKWINLLIIASLIFQTLQYLCVGSYCMGVVG